MAYPSGTLQAISAEQTYELRHCVLRPGQPINECVYPLDRAPDTYHAGYFIDGALVGVGTVFREARDTQATQNCWRVRGMAVAEHLRGSGIGGKLLQALITYAAGQGLPGEIWCNGRVSAQAFYKRYGFVPGSAIFEIPGTGPHIVFYRALTSNDLA
ncbi:MAG TPA: GNAT family N-acetyltransferase [Ktedonosporobacter sp.]|nr:GNAT family N-acetyltransferase [Ktedonosporobacter sp.]